MRKLIVALLGVVLIALHSEAQTVYNNTVPKGNTWYKIKTRGKYLCQISTSGSYAEHQEIAYLVSGNYSTAEVSILSEFNYNHQYVDIQWGYVGDAHERYLAFKSIPITNGIPVNGISIYDYMDKSKIIEIEEAVGIVTEIKVSNKLFVDEVFSRVGIGTSNPQSKLSVEGGDVSIGKEVNSNGKRRQLRIYGFDNGAQFSGGMHSNFDNNIRTFDISTSSATQQIKIDGSANSSGKIVLLPGSSSGVGVGTSSSGSWSAKLVVNNPQNYSKLIQLGAEGPTTWFMGIGDEAGNYFHIGENNNKRIVVDKINGNVGIGVITPSAKLDVAGTIKAQEIEVTLASIDDMQLYGTLAANNITLTTNGQTADFVFSDSYQLAPLSEIESFIKTNKHLPEIPSAAQMEEQGVNLAEMNKLLLQKVEELTLYMIDLKKENKIIKGERNTEKVERKALEGEVYLIKRELSLIKEMVMKKSK